jgi:hypothetical protein
MPILFTNNAATTLASAITNSATGSRCPTPTSPDFFYVTLVEGTNTEVVKVTARSTDALTIVRGQDGTTGTAFNAGARVELRINAALLQEFTQKSNPQYLRQVLTDGATVNWDAKNGQAAQLTLAGNRTIANPTNLQDASYLTLKLIQDGTGNRTVTWGSMFKWAGGAVPVLSTSAGAVDILSFYYDGTNLNGSYMRGMA